VLRAAGPWFLNHPLYIRAILAVRRGDAPHAIELVYESLLCSRHLHDRFAFVYALIPLASAATLIGDHAWAARILGARDAVTGRIGGTAAGAAVRDLREAAERAARARLGPAGWDDAYAMGMSASVEALIAEVEQARGDG
jgi:hypothetical protein